MRDAENGELHEGVGRSGGAAPELSEKEKKAVELRELLKPGDTVFTKLNHVSRSGMTRIIEVMVFRDSAPVNITYDVSQVLDYKVSNSKHWGLKVGGCGMDMGFSVVYNLSSALYRGIGYDCIEDRENGVRCPAADHVNMRDKSKIPSRHYDGYALSQRWL